MKKVMFAMAFAVVAMMGQAADFKWSIANATVPGSDEPADGYVAMLFLTSNTGSQAGKFTLTTKDAITTLIGTEDWQTEIAKLNNGVSAPLNEAGTIAAAVALQGFVKDDVVSAFAVLFDSDDLATAQNYVVLDTLAESYKWTNNTSAKTAAFGDISAITSDKSNWTSTSGGVPEPTSGLLLLIGMAGLALRRRHA